LLSLKSEDFASLAYFQRELISLLFSATSQPITSG